MDLTGISRIEQGRHRSGGAYYAWWVRMGWVVTEDGRKLPTIQRAFPDRAYGGKRRALEAAIRFRDDPGEAE